MAKRSYFAPRRKAYDVVVVGGAVIGSSVAYWLTGNADFNGSVLVIERDSSYEFSSTTLSTSAIRQQFSNPINVRISQFGIAFIRGFADRMAPFFRGEPPPDLSFKRNGYLYCCSPEGVEAARARVELQRSLGAHTVFLDPGQLHAQFPYLNVEDLGGGCWGSRDEGWFDSTGLLQGFRRAAQQQGAEYVENEVVDVERIGDAIVAVRLKTGEQIECGEMVNAAGPRCRTIANMADLDIPVEPRKRHSFVFACATPIAGLMPNVINVDGTFVRPEQDLFLSGNTPEPDNVAAVDDFETKHDEFEERMWPSLAHRIPQFEAIKVRSFWTGHYAYNVMDQNAIVGRHSSVRNFLFANGFSGHGLQQSPAVGRAIMELIVHGAFITLDLEPLRYERVEEGIPFLEEAII